jgi:hypothetical protein
LLGGSQVGLSLRQGSVGVGDIRCGGLAQVPVEVGQGSVALLLGVRQVDQGSIFAWVCIWQI